MSARHFSVVQDVDGAYMLRGELTIHDLDYLKDFLESSVDRSQKVSLSLLEVSFADTASLQFLAAFLRGLSQGKVLEILDFSPELKELLSLSGLDKHIK